MANHKSAVKRNRQNVRRRVRNAAHRSLLKSTVKAVVTEVEHKHKDNAKAELKVAEKALAKIASKGIIHKRAAARKISQLAKKVHKLSSAG